MKRIKHFTALFFSLFFIVSMAIPAFCYDNAKLSIYVNGTEKTNAAIIGNTINVRFSLQSPELLLDGQGFITYDKNSLTLNSVSFPNINNVFYNSEKEGKVLFDFYGIDTQNKTGIYNFSEEKVFVDLHFSLISGEQNNTEVRLFFQELETYNESYVYNSEITESGAGIVNSKIKGEIGFSDLFVTEEPTVPSSELCTTSFYVNGKKLYDTKVTSQEMDVKFLLKTPELIMDGDGYILYDSDVFELSSVDFPKLSSGLIVNTNRKGKVNFSFIGVDVSNRKGIFDFTSEAVLVNLVFRVKSYTMSDNDISLVFKDLDSYESSYVFNSEITNGGQSIFDNMSMPEVVFSNISEDDIYTFDDSSYIHLKDTFTRDENDTKLSGISNKFKNLQVLGVQKKINTDNRSIRFVTVVDRRVINDADDYGYIAVGTSSIDYASFVLNKLDFENTPSKHLFSCKGTSNTVSGNYGKYDSNTKYKYVTYAVNNIEDNAIAVKFYVKKGNRIYYADYTNKDAITKDYCVTNWDALI